MRMRDPNPEATAEAGRLLGSDRYVSESGLLPPLEAQPWQTPPLQSVETKVGRVEKAEGERQFWEGAGEGRKMLARQAKGPSPLQVVAGSLLTDWMSLFQ